MPRSWNGAFGGIWRSLAIIFELSLERNLIRSASKSHSLNLVGAFWVEIQQRTWNIKQTQGAKFSVNFNWTRLWAPEEGQAAWSSGLVGWKKDRLRECTKSSKGYRCQWRKSDVGWECPSRRHSQPQLLNHLRRKWIVVSILSRSVKTPSESVDPTNNLMCIGIWNTSMKTRDPWFVKFST